MVSKVKGLDYAVEQSVNQRYQLLAALLLGFQSISGRLVNPDCSMNMVMSRLGVMHLLALEKEQKSYVRQSMVLEVVWDRLKIGFPRCEIRNG